MHTKSTAGESGRVQSEERCGLEDQCQFGNSWCVAGFFEIAIYPPVHVILLDVELLRCCVGVSTPAIRYGHSDTQKGPNELFA